MVWGINGDDLMIHSFSVGFKAKTSPAEAPVLCGIELRKNVIGLNLNRLVRPQRRLKIGESVEMSASENQDVENQNYF